MPKRTRKMSHSIGFYFSGKFFFFAISKMFCLDFGLDYFKKIKDFEE